MGGFSLIHWIIVLVIVVLIFGTKRLPGIGKDLGDAMRGFKKGLHGDDAPTETKKLGDDAADSKNDKPSGQ